MAKAKAVVVQDDQLRTSAQLAEELDTVEDNKPMKLEVSKGVSYEDLHRQLKTVISGTTPLHRAAKNSDEAAKTIRIEMETASDEEKGLLERQLEALDELVSLTEDEGKKAADKVMQRKKIDKDQAADLLKYLQKSVQASEVLGDRIGLSLSEVLEDYLGKIGNRNMLDADFRMELFKELGEHLAGSELLSSAKGAANIAQAIEDGVELGTKEATKTATAEIEKVMADVSRYEGIHDLAKGLAESSLTEKESLSELKRLGVLLEDMDGFAEEQAKLAALSRDDVEKNTENIVDLKNVLWRLADRTMETKMLHTLNQIEHKFAKSILTSSELEKSITKNSLGKELLKNPGKVSAGGLGTAAMLASSIPGLQWLAGPAMLMDSFSGMGGGGGMGFSEGILGALGLKKAAGGIKNMWGKMRGKAPAAAAGGSRGAVGKALGTAGRGLMRTRYGRVLGLAGAGAAAYGGYSLFDGDDGEVPETARTVEEPFREDSAGYAETIAPTEAASRTVVPNEPSMPPEEAPTSDIGGASIGMAAAVGTGALAAERLASRKAAGTRMGRWAQGVRDRRAARKAAKGTGRMAQAATRATSAIGGTKAMRTISDSRTGKALGTAGRAAKTVSKFVGRRALGPLFAVGEYAFADSSEERKKAVGGGVGGAVGAAVGQVLIPIPVVGALVGGAVGYAAGEWLSGKFVDAEDRIPDEVKNLGPLMEEKYIDSVIAEGQWLDVKDGNFSSRNPAEALMPEEVDGLRKYYKGLLARANVRDWLEDSSISDLDEGRKIPAVARLLTMHDADRKTASIFMEEAENLWKRKDGTPSRMSRMRDEPVVGYARGASDDMDAVAGMSADMLPASIGSMGHSNSASTAVHAANMHRRSPAPIGKAPAAAPSRSARKPPPFAADNPGSAGGSGVPSMQPDEFGIALARSMIFN